MQLADTLSRANIPGMPKDETGRVVQYVNMIRQLKVTDTRKESIGTHTASDSTLQTLMTTIAKGDLTQSIYSTSKVYQLSFIVEMSYLFRMA